MDAWRGSSSDLHAKVLRHTLDEVNSHHVGSDHGEDGGSEDCCVICLDTVSEPCSAQPCAHHNFDFLCLVSWLQERTTCPLCKAEVREVRYNFSHDLKRWKTFKVESQTQPEPATAAAPLRTPRGIYRGSRLAQHRQRREHRPRPQPTPDEAILRRRDIYRNQLYSLHVGSNRMSRYQDLTPMLFETDPELVSRARKWIRRELQVFVFLSSGTGPEDSQDATSRRRANNAEFLLEYVIAILKTIDTQGSCGQAEDMLQEFLGRDNTRLFLHELRAWLRSPYTSLEDWDRHVQYDESKKSIAGSSSRGAAIDNGLRGRPRSGSHWRPQGTSSRNHPYRGRRDRRDSRLRGASQRWAPD